MKLTKIIAITVLILAWLWVWALPVGNQLDLSDELASLPDHDLRSMAEEFWRNGEEDTAMMVLDYLIEQDMGDKAAALQLRTDCLRQLRQAGTPVGRLKAAGWGFVSGEVKNWESLAGSTLGDLVVYGDLRDLTREIVFENDTDEFVVVLSGLGVATTAFPPADPAVSLVKGLKKTASLGEPLVKQLTKTFKVIVDTPSGAGKIEKMKDGLLPFYDLSKNTKTWTEYTTLIKHTDSLDQVKAMTKIAAHQPGNARKLTQILSVAGKNGMAGGKQAMDVVMTHGQKGMDTLYAAIRKGPKGLKFVADHPTLVARGLKGVRKTGVWVGHEVADWLRPLGALAVFLKACVLGLLSVFLFRALVPGAILNRFVRTRPGDAATKPASFTQRLLTSQTGVACLIGLVVMLLVLAYTGLTPAGSSTPGPDGSIEVSGAFTASGDAAASPVLSALMVILTIATQLGIWVFVRNKLADVERPGDSPQLQVKRLENLDVFFDLPLYAGLALTIFSFILITYNPGVSRLLAYTSTIIGILAAVSLRIHLVHPLKERLVKKTELSVA